MERIRSESNILKNRELSNRNKELKIIRKYRSDRKSKYLAKISKKCSSKIRDENSSQTS
jgi:U3 small nucleolar RNA-associated protein 14